MLTILENEFLFALVAWTELSRIFSPCSITRWVEHALIASEMHVKLTSCAARFNLHSMAGSGRQRKSEKKFCIGVACQWRRHAGVPNVIFPLLICCLTGWWLATKTRPWLGQLHHSEHHSLSPSPTHPPIPPSTNPPIHSLTHSVGHASSCVVATESVEQVVKWSVMADGAAEDLAD